MFWSPIWQLFQIAYSIHALAQPMHSLSEWGSSQAWPVEYDVIVVICILWFPSR